MTRGRSLRPGWLAVAAPLLLTALAPAASVAELAAQEVVPVHREPRHRLVLDRHPIRVLDIQIEPGDTTLFHRHDAPVAYVTIGVSTTNAQSLGGRWGGAQSAPSSRRTGSLSVNLAYGERPQTHRVTNVGSSLFRLIGIVNYGPGDHSPGLHEGGSPGVVDAENPWFRAYRLVLQPGEASPMHFSPRHVVGVQVSEGRAEVFATGVGAKTLGSAGEWFFLDPESEHRIRNLGTAPLELVVVEVR
jgi:quercetin dioxygenase-like cupin family protein